MKKRAIAPQEPLNEFGSLFKCWHSFWYVTDGWKVYAMYIEQSRSSCLQNLYMVGKSDSLNLAVAGSLLLYEVYKSKTVSKSRKR